MRRFAGVMVLFAVRVPNYEQWFVVGRRAVGVVVLARVVVL